ncbi:hypothetical protein [Actibacterium lipolyticum]|uniref:Uncharacterized protein n=1 Tax=Actibacterium lipolyticum TaxID=1524263 RepID=A0A238KSN0_9RHOB|nr:hypothetical protein [Actibacterium lipolyticum]SMX45825.1 hypothetical protein COL8621_02900 [Actibacterium lipolyticum]
MIVAYTLYFALCLLVLIGLATMIMKIGAALGDCPNTGRAAKAGAISITSGYLAIGFGGCVLIAAIMPALKNLPDAGLFVALGVACIALGMGFSSAATTLREIVARAALQANPPAPQPEPAIEAA